MPILKPETFIYPPHLLKSPPEGIQIDTEQTVGPDPESNTSHSPTRRWVVFATKPRQEKALARQLVSWRIPFFLPLIPKSRLVRGRPVRSFIPLFAGYVFLYVTDEERAMALTTNRVCGTLDVADGRQLVSDLSQIFRLIQSDAPLTVESRLTPGQRVRIKSGPMQGLEGTVEKRRGKAVIYVAITMLQQGAVVEIDDFLLEPL